MKQLITADQPAGDTHSDRHASGCGAVKRRRIHLSGLAAFLAVGAGREHGAMERSHFRIARVSLTVADSEQCVVAHPRLASYLAQMPAPFAQRASYLLEDVSHGSPLC